MEFTGTIVRKAFAASSKSAHLAVFLVTESGEFKLERDGGNPFHDEELVGLVGRRIHCTGTVIGYVLRITGWRVLD